MFAAGAPIKFEPLADPGTSRFGDLYGGGNLGDFINNAVSIVIILATMIAVFRLMYAGFLYMTSFSEQTKTKAKKDITNVFLGLLLLLGIVIFLEQINPDLTVFNLGLTLPTPPPTQTQ